MNCRTMLGIDKTLVCNVDEDDQIYSTTKKLKKGGDVVILEFLRFNIHCQRRRT